MSEDVSDRSDTDVNGSFYTTNARTAVESTGYRLVKNIARRNPSLTQDVQMTRGHKPLYKSRSATRRNISTLRSPEPLLSQVTRHLSFK